MAATTSRDHAYCASFGVCNRFRFGAGRFGPSVVLKVRDFVALDALAAYRVLKGIGCLGL